jgi:hypothetical protein
MDDTGGKGMKTAMMLAFSLTLILLASSAVASSSTGVVVDILGSRTDNTQIVSGAEPIELEIIGSTSSNTTVSLPSVAIPDCCCRNWCYPDTCCSDDTEASYPWESMHLGVDAWYGTFWYTDVNMPKWPAVM